MSLQQQLSAALDEIAQMMDLLGEDGFRANAHARAARIVGDLTEDVAKLAKDREKLLAIEGIGPKLADKIIEFCTTGRIAEHDELVKKVPPGLLDLLRVPGLGPKTIRVLWKDGGVTDRAGLQKIIADGSILKLPRMGEKSVEKIKQSLAFTPAGGDVRLAIGLAMPIAEAVIEQLKKNAGVSHIAYAGSLRRGKETIGDIDILATAKHPEKLADAFCSMPGVQQVLVKGPTKCSVRVSTAGVNHRWTPPDGEPDKVKGLQVDLKLIPAESWGAALMYFTGSKEHNVAVRERALAMGMTLNEYGLFPEPERKAETSPQSRGVKPIAAKDEESIYKALKMVYVPPELRENRGELEFKKTPEIIEVGDIKAELHAHTTASDGSLSILDLAKEAKGRGFHTIAVTDHSKSSAIANGLSPARLREHIKAVREADAKIEGITILAGSEVDILADGSLDYDDDLLAELDVVVASPHASLSQDSATATKRMLKAIRHPLVHILGHPTGRLVNKRRGLEPDMAELFAAAKEHHVALEINTHWMRLDLRDTHVRGAMEAGCTVAIDSDVHARGDFDNLRYGVLTARRGGVTAERCVNSWSANQLLAWLRDKHSSRATLSDSATRSKPRKAR